MTRECDRAGEVAAEVLAGGFRPDGDSDLRRHVAACESCGDLVLVMSALRSERDRIRREVAVPSAGLVWWRAQLRERQEAVRRAAAPVTAVHAAALVAVIVLAAILVSTVARWAGMPPLSAFVPTLPSWAETTQSLADASPLLRYGLALGVAAWLLLGPVAIYLALRRE